MRMVFGVLSLLAAVVIVGFLARKQLAAVSAPLPALDGLPSVQSGASAAQAASPTQQTQQVQQAVQGIMQQARPMPEGEAPATK